MYDLSFIFANFSKEMLHFLCFLLLLNEKDRENEGFFLTQKAQKFTDIFFRKIHRRGRFSFLCVAASGLFFLGR